MFKHVATVSFLCHVLAVDAAGADGDSSRGPDHSKPPVLAVREDVPF